MPDPPSTADLKARILTQIRRDGSSLVSYEELRAAWPDEFGTVLQFSLIETIASEEQWNFAFLPEGIRFTPQDQKS